jgi:hypothetical protein
MALETALAPPTPTEAGKRDVKQGVFRAVLGRQALRCILSIQGSAMKLSLLATAICAAIALPAMAADVTYRADVAPLLKAQCAECHAAENGAPTLKEFDLAKEKFTKEKLGPRVDSYENLLALIVYPDSGAFMRRLDDGTSQFAGGKPGNMYKHLGETDAERAKNLATLKAWLGEGGWNLNRWKARGDVPAITKEQIDKLLLKY